MRSSGRRCGPRASRSSRAPLNAIVRLHMNSDMPVCPKCDIPMHVAEVPVVARMFAGAFIAFVGYSIIAVMLFGAVALGVPNEGVWAIAVILVVVYLITE